MREKTLFLAWQARHNQGWFPIGRLDADVDGRNYCFRYTKGAEQAERKAGFPLLVEFPELREIYQSSYLFPLFQNRVIKPGRPDFGEYVRNLALSEEADPIEILSVNGGRRVTDAYEVFPKIEKQRDGSFSCSFFLHGNRHTNPDAEERVKRLKPGENLFVSLQLNNPATGLAVQIQTKDYYMIGWSPRYLARDLAVAMTETLALEKADVDYEAQVVRINPIPAPASHRVLIEFKGYFDKHEPMSHYDFQPLVP